MTQEQALHAVRMKCAENRQDAWSLMTNLSRLDATALRNAGYKTQEEAVLSVLRDTNTENEKLIRAFEREYPE